MRRLLNPTVALITFFIGVAAASLWLINLRRDSYRLEIPTASLSTIPTVIETNPETEKYAVYSALIKDMYVDEGTKLLVIQRGDTCQQPSEEDKASDEKVEDMWQRIEDFAIKEMPELEHETIADLHIMRKECFSLRNQLDVPVKYVLVTDKDIDPLFRKGELDRAWTQFYDRYPDSSGIISFSNIGFNREMNQALVVTGRSCGGLCGAGYYVLLTKEHGIWKVKSKTMTWVS